jgi:cytochrome c biogenesis protein CcdA
MKVNANKTVATNFLLNMVPILLVVNLDESLSNTQRLRWQYLRRAMRLSLGLSVST